MKSHHTFEVLPTGPAPFKAWKHCPEGGSNPDARSSSVDGPHPVSTPASLWRQAAQAEWAVMHPDHHDLEWRYYRAGWAG